MSGRLSNEVAVDFLEQADIGATNAQNAGGWLDMKNFDRIYAKVELGTWDSGDDLDECRLEQATNSAGGSSKDLTTDGAGLNYDTGSPIDADGDSVVLEARAEDLDTDGGFSFVRLYVAEGGNTGVDNIFGVLIRHSAAYPQKQLEGAAAAGVTVYVTPNS